MATTAAEVTSEQETLGAGCITLGSSTFILDRTYGMLIKLGSGTTTLSGFNPYEGKTTLSLAQLPAFAAAKAKGEAEAASVAPPVPAVNNGAKPA